MATKRTDAFDVYASEKEQRDADMRALKLMSPHATLNGMGRRVAPLVQAARGTVPPPVSIQDAEVLVAAETQVTRNPLFADDLLANEIMAEEHLDGDDLLELVEESGLLVLDPDQSPDDAIEVSSSFLIEDVDGFPAGLETDGIPDLSAHTNDIEEITSNHLAYIETRGEIVEVIEPPQAKASTPAPTPAPAADEIPLIARHNLYNESAEYSDGVPRMSTHGRGLSSKTLKVAAPKSKNRSGWLAKAAVGAVFVAGIGAGIAFAMHSGSTPTPEHHASAPVAVAASEAAVVPPSAPVIAAPVEAEVIAAPVVAQLNAAEAQEAIEALEPTVMPLELAPLELGADDVEDVDSATPAQAAESGPVVKALPMEPTEAEVKLPAPKTTSKKKPSPKAKPKALAPKVAPDKSERTSAIVSTGKVTKADPGVLMLAAKPPCEIRIDGKMTGLRTPQRVLKLAPGNHRITLTNQEHRIKDSFKVSIVSGQKTRIVRDNTSKIK